MSKPASARVCHLSSLHYRKDLRILIRECRSLARAGFDTHYIVADGQGDELFDGVQIHDVGMRKGMPWRFWVTHKAIFRKAMSLEAQIYHFHDPELMLLGYGIKRTGAVVVADIHEDVPKEFLGNREKPWLKRVVSSWVVNQLEQWILTKLDAVITASPLVEERLRPVARRIMNLGCFPDVAAEFSEDAVRPAPWYDLVYIGSISPMRGIRETIDLIAGTGWTYALMGDFQGSTTEASLQQLPAWQAGQVHYLGFTEVRAEIISVLRQSRIGMVTLLPHPSYATAYSLKIFEYMAVGLPVVATGFPFWKTIIDVHQCGITVDSTDPTAIKTAIQYLLDNPDIAQQMGENGQKAIAEHYNWKIEERKLLDLYACLLEERFLEK